MYVSLWINEKRKEFVEALFHNETVTQLQESKKSFFRVVHKN